MLNFTKTPDLSLFKQRSAVTKNVLLVVSSSTYRSILALTKTRTRVLNFQLLLSAHGKMNDKALRKLIQQKTYIKSDQKAKELIS